MNFVEGTRYTERQARGVQVAVPASAADAPGGTAFVLSAMGGMLHAMLDVTIAYRGAAPSLWDLCCGRLGTVIVDVRKRPIDELDVDRRLCGRPGIPRALQGVADGCGTRRTGCSTSCCPGENRRDLGSAVAFHPRAGRASCRDRRLRPREQRVLRRVDGRLRLGALDRAGHPPELCRSLNRGMAVWRTQVHYLGAAYEGDRIQVATWPVRNDGKLRIERRFQMRRAVRRADAGAGADPLRVHRSRDGQGETHAGGIHAATPCAPDVAAAVAAETEPFQPGVEPR